MGKGFSEIIFTGTSSGQTSAARNHSSIFIKTNGHNLLIDAGDGISKALLTQKINFNEIHSILFTHYHADHFAGIASLITQMKLLKRKSPLTMFTHKNLVPPLESLLNSVYMFKDDLGFELKVTGFDFGEEIQTGGRIKFYAKRNTHLRQKENLKNYPEEIFISSSFLFNVGGTKLFYTSDVGSREDLFLFNNKEFDFAVTEACHIKCGDIYEFIRIKKPRKIFITHYDDEYEKELHMWRSLLSEDEKEKIIICRDGLSFRL